MSIWNVGNSNSYSNSYSNSVSGFSGMTSMLGEYSSIQSGSYKKLLTQYYKENPVKDISGTLKESKATDTKEDLLKLRSKTDDLKKATATLTATGSKSIFEKVKTKSTDENGVVTETEDYDRDAIAKALGSFVTGYNNVLESVGDLNTEGILKKGLMMTSATKANSNLLSKVGITIGKDNKLSIDEDKLKSASINDLKTLFNGSGSFADKVGQRSTQLSLAAAKADTTANLYGVNGKFSNFSSGNFYNSLV